jgi:hypothetical protein
MTDRQKGSSLLLALGQSYQFAFYRFPKFAIAIFHHKESRADLIPFFYMGEFENGFLS